MKKQLAFIMSMTLFGAPQLSMGAKEHNLDKASHHMHHNMVTEDTRTSLNLSPAMKQHQLSNMRNHLDAVRRIVESLSTEKFEQASKIASQELGLTKRMEGMCKSFNNESFTEMGLSFHKSADELADVLKSGDMKQSLQALNTTMNYCVTCHATFKQ